MRRRSGIARRRVIFVGVEGKSDRAFVQFLRRCCDEKRLHLHLDVKPGNGGDSVDVVDAAGRYLRRHAGRRHIKHRLVLLDADRLKQDQQADRDAFAVARAWRLKIILQKPNLEGVLLRLHEGHEQRRIRSEVADRALRKRWPDYTKGSLSAVQLRRRFSLRDVQRAAAHDEQLRELLEILGL